MSSAGLRFLPVHHICLYLPPLCHMQHLLPLYHAHAPPLFRSCTTTHAVAQVHILNPISFGQDELVSTTSIDEKDVSWISMAPEKKTECGDGFDAGPSPDTHCAAPLDKDCLALMPSPLIDFCPSLINASRVEEDVPIYDMVVDLALFRSTVWFPHWTLFGLGCSRYELPPSQDASIYIHPDGLHNASLQLEVSIPSGTPLCRRSVRAK